MTLLEHGPYDIVTKHIDVFMEGSEMSISLRILCLMLLNVDITFCVCFKRSSCTTICHLLGTNTGVHFALLWGTRISYRNACFPKVCLTPSLISVSQILCVVSVRHTEHKCVTDVVCSVGRPHRVPATGATHWRHIDVARNESVSSLVYLNDGCQFDHLTKCD